MMAGRNAGTVDLALKQDAVGRLLEWGFSYEEIATNIGHTETWVREVHEAQRVEDSVGLTGNGHRARTITPENEE